MKSIENWYESINQSQKIFLWVISFIAIICYGIGLLPLAGLIYLELGKAGTSD